MFACEFGPDAVSRNRVTDPARRIVQVEPRGLMASTGDLSSDGVKGVRRDHCLTDGCERLSLSARYGAAGGVGCDALLDRGDASFEAIQHTWSRTRMRPASVLNGAAVLARMERVWTWNG